MSSSASPQPCIIDSDGLLEIANASPNIKAVLLSHLANGYIEVPTCAWKEFRDIYDGKADELEPHVLYKINMSRHYRIGAAQVADTVGSGFPRGPYDENVELITAAISICDGKRIITSTSQCSVYKKMNCESMTIYEFMEFVEDLKPA